MSPAYSAAPAACQTASLALRRRWWCWSCVASLESSVGGDRRSQPRPAPTSGKSPDYAGPMSGDGLYGREAELEAIAGALDAVARGGRRLLIVARRGRHRQDAAAGRAARARRGAALRRARGPRDRARARRPARADRRRARARRSRAPMRWRRSGPSGSACSPRSSRGSARPAAARRRGHRALAPAPRARRAARAVAGGRPLAAARRRRPLGRPGDAASCSSTSCAARRPTRCCVALGLRPGPAAERLLAAQRAEPRGRASSRSTCARWSAAPPRRCWRACPAPASATGSSRSRAATRCCWPSSRATAARTRCPAGIVAAVRAEVEALPADARALVQAAAVAGDPFELDLATRIAALDEPAALDALDVVEQHGPGRAPPSDPRRFAFRHPVMRTAVHETLGAGARLAGHAAAARELARAGAPLAVRAQHLAHAAAPGDVEAAATLRAAAAGVRLQAPGVAADWLLAALRADPAGGRARGAGRDARRGRAAGRPRSRSSTTPPRRPGRRGWPSPARASSGCSGRHDAARRRLLARARGDRARQPGGAPACWPTSPRAAYLRGEYAEMREWAQQIEPTAERRRRRARRVHDAARGRRGVRGRARRRRRRDRRRARRRRGRRPTTSSPPRRSCVAAVSWGLLALERLADGLAVGPAARRPPRAPAGNGLASIPHDLAAVLALGLLGPRRPRPSRPPTRSSRRRA